MTPTTLTALKTVIKYIKKEYNTCKDYNPLCYQCQMNGARLMLEEILATEKWRENAKWSLDKKEVENIKKGMRKAYKILNNK